MKMILSQSKPKICWEKMAFITSKAHKISKADLAKTLNGNYEFLLHISDLLKKSTFTEMKRQTAVKIWHTFTPPS